MHIYLALVLSSLLVIGMAAVGSTVVLILRNRSSSIVWSLVFGICLALASLLSVQLSSTVTTDLTTIIMALAGYVGGTVTALLVLLFGAATLLWQGGSLMPGLFCLALFGTLGTVLKRYVEPQTLLSWKVLAVVGPLFGCMSLFNLYNIEEITLPVVLSQATFGFAASLGVLGAFSVFYGRVLRYTVLLAAFEANPTHVMALNHSGELTLVNSSLDANSELKRELMSYLRDSPAAPHSTVMNSGQVINQEISVSLTGGQRDYFAHVAQLNIHKEEPGCVAILEDITELKHTTAQLDTFFVILPDALVVIDANYMIQRSNKSLSKILGYDHATLISRPLMDLVHLDDVAAASATCRSLFEGNEASARFDCRFIAADGSIRWLSWTCVAVLEEQVVYALGRDITEQQMVEQAAQEQASRLEEQLELLELAHDAIIARSLDNTITFWNKGAEQNYGWTKQEVIGANYHEILQSDYGTFVEDIENELLRLSNWSGEASRLTRDGTRIIANCQWVVQRDADGWPLAILEISRDITQRKQVEIALAQLAAIVEQSDDGIISVDLDGKILTWNQGAEQILGYSAEEIRGREFSSLLVPGHSHSWRELLHRRVLGERLDQLDTYLVHKQGQIVAVLVSISAIRNMLSQPSAMSLVLRDITHKKLLDREIARLDRLNLAGQLAVGIGHEVRNPMTTVRGFLQLFARKPELRKYTDQFSLVISELDRANDIITEFLTLARNRPIDVEEANLNDSIVKLVPLLQSDAQIANKKVNLDLGDLPNIKLSSKEIRQLILNLVRNGFEAMKSGGTLTISTSCQGNKVVLAVKDEGHGIPLEVAEKIGTPFFTTKQNGTGLGLAVCYTIAEQHGATVSFETSEQGTTFFVSFRVI